MLIVCKMFFIEIEKEIIFKVKYRSFCYWERGMRGSYWNWFCLGLLY